MNEMEKTVEDLKKVIPFKDGAEPGDVVLIVKEADDENPPVFISYARINGFDRDPGKIDEWWFVHLTFLTVPPQPATLILQTPHFTGREIFTMGGKKVFIKALDFSPKDSPKEGVGEPESAKRRGGLKLVKD